MSVAAPRFVLEVLAEKAVNINRVTQRMGLDRATLDTAEARVSSGTVMRLLDEGSLATDDPWFGAHLARDYRPGRLGLLDYLFLSARTLRDAFDTVIRCGSAVAAYGRYTWSRYRGKDGVERAIPVGVGANQAESFVLGWELTMARYATGRQLWPTYVGLSQPSPQHPCELAAVFGVREIAFDCCSAFLTFSDADLDSPILGSDPALAQTLRQHAEARCAGPISWVERVRGFLAGGFINRVVSLETAASQMAISPRMLQQHLHSVGTSWQNELDRKRDSLATALLHDEGLTMAVIAERLGFTDVRAFRRVFHHRHGCSPSQYRQEYIRAKRPY